MALGNISSAMLGFPPELLNQVGFLISILQFLGGAIIFYIIFNIIMVIINKKRNQKIDKILLGIDNINKNLEGIKNILYRK